MPEGKIDFSKFKLPPEACPNTEAFAEFSADTKQIRGTFRGYLRKYAWPTVVRGWRLLRLRPSKR